MAGMQADATETVISDRGTRTVWWSAAALVLVVTAAYANSFRGVMLLDDRYIERTPALGDPALWGELKKSMRPVVDLTYAVNQRIDGLAPVGYHVVNFLVHLAATLTLFGLVRRSLGAPGVTGEGIRVKDGCEKEFSHQQSNSRPRQHTILALAIALLWSVHPLQTQSVTYIAQRAESMAGLFYLLTLYCIARSACGGGSTAWQIGAVVACALGMSCKQILVTAPVMAVFYDRAFWSTSWAQVLSRRWKLYTGLAATWGLLFLMGSVREAVEKDAAVGFGVASVTPVQYLLTQFGVIRHYLRLSIWPDLLCLDYQWPVAHSFAEAAGPAMFVLLLIGLTIIAWVRRPAEGFLGVWFFGVLLTTSSFIPIKDVIFEHRMYLSLASVAAIAVLGVHWILRRRVGEPARARWIGAALVSIAAAALVVRTHQRNRDYSSAARMWESVVERYPHHARALNNLGAAYIESGRLVEAEKYCREAVKEDPSLNVAQYNLGHALMLAGRGREAIAPLESATADAEVFPSAMLDLGTIYAGLGRLDPAISCFRRALHAQPENADAYFNLGNALRTKGDRAGAVAAFREVLRLRPEDEEARRAERELRAK